MLELTRALLGNVGMFLALAVLYDALGFPERGHRPLGKGLINGLLLGLIGIAVMGLAYELSPGIVFDVRSVVLALGALFLGALPAIVAVAVTGGFRLALGGAGVAMGLAVIVTSAGIGLAWRRARGGRLTTLSLGELYLLGVVVHVAMLLCTSLLPAKNALDTLRTIAVPVMLVYPIATALAGWVLRRGHERRRVEMALRESEGRFRALIESAEDPIFVKSPERVYTLVNPAMGDLWGIEPERVVGRTDQELFGDEGEAETAGADRRVLTGETVRTTDRLVIGGTPHWFSVTRFPLFGEDGRIELLAGIARDVTGSIRVREDLRRLNEELERRVALRTAELEDRREEAERLSRAMLNLVEDLRAEHARTEKVARQLELTNRELEAFAYSVSHDLRAPLRAIEGFGSALMEEAAERLEPEQRDNLARIRAAAGRMAEMIDGLLELARATQVEMKRREVDLSELANDVIEEIRAGEPARDVKVSVEPGLRARGDPQLLRLVLQNLIGNAWKFTTSVPGAMVEFGLQNDKGDRVFYVRDNGVGFDMKYAEQLFGAFRRLHRREAFPGAGIGLATVKRVIARHGGEVWADARPGEGATFFFTLEKGRAT